MMPNLQSFVSVIKACQATGVKKEKLAALATLDETGKRLCVEAMSPFRVFGVKKYPEPQRFAKTMTSQDDPTPFFTLLDDLVDRKLTGNAAKDAVVKTLELYSQETQTVLRLVLNKDMKAGFSDETLNKVYPNLVPVFNVMLAEKLDDNYDWQFPLLGEYKMDGERTIGFCENGAVEYRSRSGLPAEHCNGLFDDDLRAIEKVIGEPIVIDGERYASNFTETMNAKKSGDSKAKDNLRLIAYDFMTLAQWDAKNCPNTQEVRRDQLSNVLKTAKCVKITLSNGKLFHSVAEAREYFKLALSEKFEGLILKKLDGLYTWDRGPEWVKYKQFYTYDGKIVGFYPGRKGSRLENTLGGINIAGIDENGNQFTASCGSGFSDAQRDYFWTHQEELLDTTVEVETQEITRNASTGVSSLRFPVFARIRDDK